MRFIAKIPMSTPNIINIILFENATTEQILSIENAISITSTKHTVDQNTPKYPTVERPLPSPNV
jgi:hypothetical protein